MSKLINIRQVAQLFGVSKRTIERWVKDSKLPKPIRRFGIRKWDFERLESLLKTRRRT
jgi:excisionase family DNA binding protein